MNRDPDPPHAGEKLLSLGLWGAGLAWLAGGMGSLLAAQCFAPADRLEWLNRLYCRGQVLLTGSRWQAFVHPSIDPNRVYMFCQNHINHLDHCTMYNATPHFKQGLELESHFRYPVYGWFMKQRGTIPVRRGQKSQRREMMRHMEAEVARGHSILTFPEGHRTRDGRVRRFHKGVFYIARDLGLPIVPVAVTGMQDVMRADCWLIRPGYNVSVYCEEPVETVGIPDRDIDLLAKRVRESITRHVNKYLDSPHPARRWTPGGREPRGYSEETSV